MGQVGVYLALGALGRTEPLRALQSSGAWGAAGVRGVRVQIVERESMGLKCPPSTQDVAPWMGTGGTQGGIYWAPLCARPWGGSHTWGPVWVAPFYEGSREATTAAFMVSCLLFVLESHTKDPACRTSLRLHNHPLYRREN